MIASRQSIVHVSYDFCFASQHFLSRKRKTVEFVSVFRQSERYVGRLLSENIDYSRMQFSLRPTLPPDVYSVTFVWSRLFYRAPDLHASCRVTPGMFSLSDRFDHTAPRFCGSQPRVLPYRCYIGARIYTIQFSHPVVGLDLLYSINRET